METEWRQNGDKLETEWRQKNINDSDKGLSEKHLVCNGFHAILHDNVHKRLMAFPSMSCRCIFVMQAGETSTVHLVAKWTFFWILQALYWYQY